MISDAEKIASLVMQASTESRGDLLMQVAMILQNNLQGFTSSVFYRAAIDYKQIKITDVGGG